MNVVGLVRRWGRVSAGASPLLPDCKKKIPIVLLVDSRPQGKR